MKIGIIDYQLNNISSIQGAIKKLNFTSQVIRDPSELINLDRIILPGVGSFSNGMQSLIANNWIPKIKYAVVNLNTPILGICLGMQLLADYGFEGAEKDDSGTPGLSLIAGTIEILPANIYKLRLPHVGWNEVSFTESNSGLNAGIKSNSDFYFVHSYFFKPTNKNVIIGKCNYGINFPSVIQHQNIFGVQFHPEKSSRAGLQILKNFIEQV